MDTILILHGWGSGAKNWFRVKELLENQGYKVFLPDLPGFGENPPPPQPWTVDNYVNWINDFCGKQNLSRFFLLGHSFGGRIAIKFATKYPEKILNLILYEAAGIKHKKTVFQFVFFLISKCGRMFVFLPFYSFFRKFFYRFIVRKKDYLRTKGVMKDTFLKVIEEDLTPYLSQIFVHTFIIWGEKDKITPLTDAHLMKKEISNSELKIIPEMGHAFHHEHPEKLTEIVVQLIKS